MDIVTNYQLFSHTYLAKLRADPALDAAATNVVQGLREWFRFRKTSSLPQLLDSWVSPILDFLDFHHPPAADAPHIHLLYAPHREETPLGLCYVVPAEQNLNDTIKGRHPMAQVIQALRARDLRWGILTNGIRWRLVDARALQCYEHYVEVQGDDLARSQEAEPARLFYTFFHSHAFMVDEAGESGLDRLAAASERATAAAEAHLKARVSHNEGIMAQLCLGLVRAAGKDKYTAAERDAIYRDATYLLYRILFILYAEARGLLPVDNPAYRAVSLAELVKVAHDYQVKGIPDPQATTLWTRLKRLGAAIYASDAALGIPAYNGGLFDDADKPYLRAGYIADTYLTAALVDLAYQSANSAPHDYQPLDYRDLSVRHLGSLYEGMIEYKLFIAEEPMLARRDQQGNVHYLTRAEAGVQRRTDAEIPQGDVYFAQNSGERRATGTYYTPEYIVDYIVRQTVWRGLAERRQPLEEQLAEDLPQITAAFDRAEQEKLQHAVDAELDKFVAEQVLTFTVCDPAMGSGHFLVNAAHQMTAFIVETLHLTPWVNEGISTDPVYWRRRVTARCLYGVDLSLMAVELAKLSLWLASVAAGKPLSFLDHHLRHGNSLIGARLADLAELVGDSSLGKASKRESRERAAGQISMMDSPAFREHVTAATDLLTRISTRVAERIEDVKAQEGDYAQVRAELAPYRQLADVVTARHFGVDVNDSQLREIADCLTKDTVGVSSGAQSIINDARLVSANRNFFHWQLEFPEFLLLSMSGFDAVIGNPPYGRYGTMDRFARGYIRESDISFYTGDMSEAFISMAMQIAGGNIVGLIVPKVITYVTNWANIRQRVKEGGLILVIDMSEAFADVLYEQVILCFQNSCQAAHVTTAAFEQGKLTTRSQVSTKWFGRKSFPLYLNSANLKTYQRVHLCAVNLGDLYDYWYGKGGVVPYLKDTFDDLRVIQGRDVQRYSEHDYPKVYLSSQHTTEREVALSEKRKIAVQDIIAYVTYPFPRIIIMATIDDLQRYPLNTTTCFAEKEHSHYCLDYLCSLLNSRLISWYVHHFLYNRAVRTMHFMPGYVERVPVRRIHFTTPESKRQNWASKIKELYAVEDYEQILVLVNSLLPKDSLGNFLIVDGDENKANVHEQSDVVHDLLSYLAQQMTDLHKTRQQLERDFDLFRFAARDASCLKLDQALGAALAAGEGVNDISTVHHDIEELRLNRQEDGRWLLEARLKLRDPQTEWAEHQRDDDGKFIREWWELYHLPLDEARGWFYHYAFANLDGFAGAGKFPGGKTRSTREKLQATKVPEFTLVDLKPLVETETELAETRRRIRLTDELIDQIVYKLYGLTEEEIAIVEGRA